jgi:hypothetical protein
MDARALLECWEHGGTRHAIDRALLLFSAAAPTENPDALADRTLGERNAALLRLRQKLFGDRLQSCVDCPECGERLEFTLSASTLLGREAAPAGPENTRTLFCGDIQLRLPTSRDLAMAAAAPDIESAELELIRSLLISGNSTPLTGELRNELAQILDTADPCLDFAVNLACPECAHDWTASFDVAEFLWEEIDSRARRLLDEVDLLARTYGWSERHILELSDGRRHAYLERVQA